MAFIPSRRPAPATCSPSRACCRSCTATSSTFSACSSRSARAVAFPLRARTPCRRQSANAAAAPGAEGPGADQSADEPVVSRRQRHRARQRLQVAQRHSRRSPGRGRHRHQRPASDEALAQEVLEAIEQLANIGNHQFSRTPSVRRLAGGCLPFEVDGEYVTYHGNEGALSSFVDLDLPYATNVPGSEVFGTFSPGVRGTVDLNPALTANTPLSELHGGGGVVPGSIAISRRHQHADFIDLSSAATIGDVADLIARQSAGGPHAHRHRHRDRPGDRHRRRRRRQPDDSRGRRRHDGRGSGHSRTRPARASRRSSAWTSTRRCG